MLAISLGVLLVAAGGILSVFFFYPLAVFIGSRLFPLRLPRDNSYEPTVTVLTATRNAADFIDAKIDNTFALDYPEAKLDLVITLDGSDSLTEQRIATRASPRITLVVTDRHLGKATALNRALPHCSGEILLMTDADAILAPGALRMLLRHFADAQIGGVGGRRVIARDSAAMKRAQQHYIAIDSGLKSWESRLGYTTANDGKLYAVRRDLIDEIPEGVTDDLYATLFVASQRKRFLFEPAAVAEIRVPSRNPAHEIRRRRRIVCRSLTGIWMMKSVLNPFRDGWFAVGLLVNKVFRRLLPVNLALLLLGSLLVWVLVPWSWPLAVAQIAFYGLAAVQALSLDDALPRPLRRFAGFAFYFCVGNLGTLLGLLDFLAGKRVVRWDPIKQDRLT